MHRKHVARAVEAQPVHRLNKGSIDVVHLNAAAARSGAGKWLGDEEQLVHRIVLDSLPTERAIVLRGIGKQHTDPAAGVHVVELHGRIERGRGADDVIL